MPPAIRTTGIKQLRKEFKALGKEAPKELTQALKSGAELTLPLARTNIQRVTGRLSASLRASGAGNAAAIRSTVEYSAVVHWRKNESTRSRHFVVRAVDAKADAIVDGIEEAITNIARRHGWH